MSYDVLSNRQRSVMGQMSAKFNESFANLFGDSLGVSPDEYLKKPFVKIKSNWYLGHQFDTENGMIADLIIGERPIQFVMPFNDDFILRLNNKSSDNVDYMSRAMCENVYTVLAQKSDKLLDKYVRLLGPVSKNRCVQNLSQFAGLLLFIEETLSSDFSIYNSSFENLNFELTKLIKPKLGFLNSDFDLKKFGSLVCDFYINHVDVSYNFNNTEFTNLYVKYWTSDLLVRLFSTRVSWLFYLLLFLWDKLMKLQLTSKEYSSWTDFVNQSKLSSNVDYSGMFGCFCDILINSNPQMIKKLYKLGKGDNNANNN